MAFNSAIVDNLYDFDPVRRLFQYEGVAMETYRREHYLTQLRPFYDDSDLIKVITGIRRCGKSSLMNTVMDELLKLKVPKTTSSTSTWIAGSTAPSRRQRNLTVSSNEP